MDSSQSFTLLVVAYLSYFAQLSYGFCIGFVERNLHNRRVWPKNTIKIVSSVEFSEYAL